MHTIKKSADVLICALVSLATVLLIIFAYTPLPTDQTNISMKMKPMMRFASKSPYIFTEPNSFVYEEYSPVKIWTMYRHGIRLPGKEKISKYNALLDRIHHLQNSTHLTDDEKSAFKNWKPMPINLNHQKFLTKEGEEELFNLGKRFKKQFLHYFTNNNLQEAQFTFKHTPTQRTSVSARKFIEGLFGSNETHQSIEVLEDDPILRPYKGCAFWLKTIKKNPDAYAEKQTLIKSVEVENLVNEMREVTRIPDLDFKDIELIYTMCGFETAWRHLLHNEKSIWCSVFKNEHHLSIMEYLEDIRCYWIDGPGFEMTRKTVCNTVNDILRHLDPSNTERSLSFYFTHSGTILKLLTLLELYNDDFHLTADKLNHERLWRTSLIDTFSSNIIFILYDSKHGPHVQLLHQENVINIPKCNSNEFGMCKYEDFKKIYDQKIQNCTFSTLCSLEN